MFATLVDTSIDRLAGVVMLVCGAVVLARSRSTLVGSLLGVAALTWLLPSIALGPFSTLFLHRPLLAAALAIAADPLWRRFRSAAPLAMFTAVSAVPELAVRPTLTLVCWLAVLIATAVSVRYSPRRARVVPALVAQGALCAAATVGLWFGVATAAERRAAYHLAAIALAALIARVATAPLAADIVLDDRQDSRWTVALRPAQADHFVVANGRRVEPDSSPLRIEFDFGELGTGLLLHDDAAFADTAIRDRLEVAVRLACERIALLHQIERHRSEVDASRRRIVDADRRATESLQQHLAQLVAPHLDSIDRSLHVVPAEGRRAAQLLAEIRQEVAELAGGMAPVELANGLATALRSLGDRSPLATTVVAPDELELDAPTAVALYMVASESVANAAKHSGGQRLRIELRDGDGDGDGLTLVVTDDGVGGALVRDGGGLEQATHRMAALGGTVTISTNAGHGTVVTVRVPRGHQFTSDTSAENHSAHRPHVG